jgi:hypothetical protein
MTPSFIDHDNALGGDELAAAGSAASSRNLLWFVVPKSLANSWRIAAAPRRNRS